MNRSLHRLLLTSSGLLGVVTAATASAWNSPEHTEFGGIVCTDTCAGNMGPGVAADTLNDQIACNSADVKANATLVGMALQEPDHCHSFYFSNTGVFVNGVDSAHRKPCAIQFGATNASGSTGVLGSASSSPTGAITSGIKSLDQSVYALITNANHFGDNTHTHWSIYHQIALGAAQRRATLGTLYATPPDKSLTVPNPLLKTCTQDAIAIEGFALHYLTDRAAGGHAWNAEPYYVNTLAAATGSGLRGCFHGQPLGTRAGLVATTFSCVDSPLLGTGLPVHQGLGQTGRTMGDLLWGLSPAAWVSDADYDAHAPTDQQNAVYIPAKASFLEVLYALNGMTLPPQPWSDVFVSNQDFCAVALSECCHNASASGLGTCDYCNPDVSDSALKAACPVDMVQKASVSGSDWIPLAGGLVGGSLFYAHVALPNPSGTDAARSIAHADDNGTQHPDAQWDRDNDVVTLMGCAQFDIASSTVPLPSAPLDGTPVTATITYDGNPTFPVIVHWRPNTDMKAGTVCTAPPDNPHVCDPRDITVATAPMGTTPTSPMPLSIQWACPGAASTAAPFAALGTLYLTDSNNAWTPGVQAFVNCGGADASLPESGPPDTGSGMAPDVTTMGVDGTIPDILDASFEGSFDASNDSGDAPYLVSDAGLIIGSCTHDVCTAGDRLGQQCDQCTNLICAKDPYCCDTFWGVSCFVDVQNLCGHTCP